MNIRTVTNPITSIEQKPVSEVRKNVSTTESHADRDANGRRENPEPDQSPLNEEEFKKAKDYLTELESLQKSSLHFTVETRGDVRVFLIKDQNDNIVRRIPEHEMRSLVADKDKSKGHIFDKAG